MLPLLLVSLSAVSNSISNGLDDRCAIANCKRHAKSRGFLPKSWFYSQLTDWLEVAVAAPQKRWLGARIVCLAANRRVSGEPSVGLIWDGADFERGVTKGNN